MFISPEIVFGFHGCDQKIADEVIKNRKKLAFSENSYDWLGSGIYFWEGSYKRALEWASKDKKVENPAVIGAVIKIGNCLDLLDSEYINNLKNSYLILNTRLKSIGEELPKNKVNKNGFSFARDLDCRVIMHYQDLSNQEIAKELNISEINSKNIVKIQKHPQFIDSVRGMFPEGEELYPNAGFRNKNHIQLCVVNPNCIIGYFDPQKPDSNYKLM